MTGTYFIPNVKEISDNAAEQAATANLKRAADKALATLLKLAAKEAS